MKSTKEIEIAGTFLQGYVETTKAELVSVFGDPIQYADGDKVTIEWGIRFEDGTIATIYDWKRYERGTPKDNERMTYNIGGLTPRAVELVNLAIKNNKHLEKKLSFADYLNSIRPFTVGQMKEAIAGLTDETQILFGVPVGTNLNSDWFNVSQDYKRPDTDEEYLALTFFISDDYDSRQF
jgi:hypothetical protein